MSDEEEFSYDLVMPFVPVQSKGGPHDDAAYVAGFEMGRIDGLLQAAKAAGLELELSAWTPEGGQPIHSENREQADLIAMRYGFIAAFEDYDAAEVGSETTDAWIHMQIRAASEVTP